MSNLSNLQSHITDPLLFSQAIAQALDAIQAAQAIAPVKMFQSTVQTGTGSSQNVAHGLGVVPRAVLLSVYDSVVGASGVWLMTEGVHDATNVKATVTSGVKFKVLAFS